MRQTKSARVLLMRAARSVVLPDLFAPAFGVHFADGDPPPGGGATPPKAEPKKLELTEDELSAKIQAALDKQKAEADEAKKQADEAAAAKAAEEDAKKKGDIDAVQKAADEKVAKALAEAAELRVDIAIRDALAVDKFREYAGCAKYIKPLIDQKLTGDKLTSAINAAVEQYAKDNPRKTTAAPPAGPSRTGLPAGSGEREHRPNGAAVRPFSTIRGVN